MSLQAEVLQLVAEQAETRAMTTDQAKTVLEQPAMSAAMSEHAATAASFVVASSYRDDCQGANSIIGDRVVTGSIVCDCIGASSNVNIRGG